MTKISIELNDLSTKIVDAIKIEHNFSTREETILYCINQFGKEFLDPDVEKMDEIIEEDKKSRSSKALGVDDLI